jgi:hypothetical protein
MSRQRLTLQPGGGGGPQPPPLLPTNTSAPTQQSIRRINPRVPDLLVSFETGLGLGLRQDDANYRTKYPRGGDVNSTRHTPYLQTPPNLPRPPPIDYEVRPIIHMPEPYHRPTMATTVPMPNQILYGNVVYYI